MSIPRIIIVFYESIPSGLPGQPGLLLSHRFTFVDQDTRLACLITRYDTARDKVRTTEAKLFKRWAGIVAWIGYKALNFYRDREQSLEEEILRASTHRLKSRHPTVLELRHSLNNEPEKAVDLPHEAARLAERILHGRHFFFYVEQANDGA